MGYQLVYERSLSDPNGFWGDAARAIDWTTEPTVVCDDSAAPLYRWYSDGVLNTCYNAVDRHVEAGRGDHSGLQDVSPVAGSARTWTDS